jgi:diguanylate cyclase (GGDEF)-like protein
MTGAAVEPLPAVHDAGVIRSGTVRSDDRGGGEQLVCTCAERKEPADREVLALLVLLAGLAHRAPSIDGRSGLLGYDAWRARAAAILGRPRGPDERCGLLLVDIDRFKDVNDRFGHLAGDAVIRAVARVVRQQAHGHDLVGRFGGDEFVVLLDRLADHRSAGVVGERIRAAVGGLTVEVEAPDGTRTIAGVTVSVGGALDGRPPADLTQLLWTADAALYAAKHAGRNTVRLMGPGAARTLDSRRCDLGQEVA